MVNSLFGTDLTVSSLVRNLSAIMMPNKPIEKRMPVSLQDLI